MLIPSPRGIGKHKIADKGPATREMDFYEQLSKLSSEHALKANLLVVFPDSGDDVDREFSGRLVGIQKLPSVNFRDFHIAGTPTLVLVDSSGIVRQVWIGELGPGEKLNVLKAIGSNLG